METGGAPEWVRSGATPAWLSGEARAEEARIRRLSTGPICYERADLIPDEPSMSEAAAAEQALVFQPPTEVARWDAETAAIVGAGGDPPGLNQARLEAVLQEMPSQQADLREVYHEKRWAAAKAADSLGLHSVARKLRRLQSAQTRNF